MNVTDGIRLPVTFIPDECHGGSGREDLVEADRR